MHFWASLFAVLFLCTIHVVAGRLAFFDGKKRRYWISVSAGTALGYVFIYLLPKLAILERKLEYAAQLPSWFIANPYLFALAGLVAFYILEEVVDDRRSKGLSTRRGVILYAIAYGAYSMQLGYLLSDLPLGSPPQYFLATLLLGIHLAGLDNHIRHRYPEAYYASLRWLFVVATLLGWGGGAITDALQSTVMILSTFIAGTIIFTAIRVELPRSNEHSPLAFVLGVIGSTTAILLLKAMLQSEVS